MRGNISKRRMLCGSVVALRPTLSPAARAKADVQRLTAKIAAAKAKGDTGLVGALEREQAWLVVNSLV